MEKTFLKKDSPIIDRTFHSSGKLLLTGEYLVLKGAKALALKTKTGQSLKVSPSQDEFFHWKAIDMNGDVWFDHKFEIRNSKFEIVGPSSKTDPNILQILNFIKIEKKDLFNSPLSFSTQLEFNKDWGLGTSSTLIANLAKWSGTNAFKLLEISFGGSGYDVAVAMEGHSILYENKVGPGSKKVIYDPPFKEELFFVYLNEKRNSREAISSSSALLDKAELTLYTAKINEITESVLNCKTLEQFEHLMSEHESILSKILSQPSVKEHLFSDYERGICKSLGAWGGDFILVTGKPENMAYFRAKGYDTIVPFKDMIDAD